MARGRRPLPTSDEEIALRSEIRRDLDRDFKPIFEQHGSRGIPLRDLRAKLDERGITNNISRDRLNKLLQKANINSDNFIEYEEFVLLMTDDEMINLNGRKKVVGFIEAAVSNIVPEHLKSDFLAHYTCCPPPLFMIVITLAEIAVFVYYVLDLKGKNVEVTWSAGVPIYSPLIYSPTRRYEAWRFLTYMFIHQGYLHLIFNCIFQIVLGLPLEIVHKFWRLLIIYVLGVIAGSLSNSITDRYVYLAGASGGCYALIGAHLAAVIVNWKEMNHKCYEGNFCRMFLSAPVRLIILLALAGSDTGIAVYRRFVTSTADKIGISAHIGGLLAGLLLGVPIMKNINELPWEQKLGWITLAIYLACMIFAVLFNGLFKDYPETDWSACCPTWY